MSSSQKRLYRETTHDALVRRYRSCHDISNVCHHILLNKLNLYGLQFLFLACRLTHDTQATHLPKREMCKTWEARPKHEQKHEQTRIFFWLIAVMFDVCGNMGNMFVCLHIFRLLSVFLRWEVRDKALFLLNGDNS